MSNDSNLTNDEIDFKELAFALWAHKAFIIFLTGLSVLISGYIALQSEKKFTSTAIFQIEQKGGSGFSLSGEFSALASLAGFSSGSGSGSGSAALLERVKAREFILSANKKSSLYLDPYFNSYVANNNNFGDHGDPLWKSVIKRIVGWKETEIEIDDNAIIEQNVIRKYNSNVKFEYTDGGATKISVTHSNPKMAADYANGFMEQIRELVEKEMKAAQNLRLTYLSETLADALVDMERAQENLKIYALENSTMAKENFLSGSLKLDTIRMEKRRVEEIYDLLLILDNIIKSGNLDSGSYEALRSRHPIVDDIDFRRILGMSETISAWTWPKIETIEAVGATLRDRIKRLDIDIKNIEENTKIYATSAEDLAQFNRDARIAEATYTVLIEQVKSQTLAAGFNPETFKVFEYATPPLAVSSPNIKVFVVLGALIGIFSGCALSLINSIRKGLYYTHSTLLSDINAKLSLNSKLIKKLSRKSVTKINSFISNRGMIELDEAQVALANKKIIYVLNCGSRVSASNIAKLLALQSTKSGKKVILCDTTGEINKEIKDKKENVISGLTTVGLDGNVSVLKGANEPAFFTSGSFKSQINDLTTHYDQVFICSNKNHTNLVLMALESFLINFVLIASLRATRKTDLRKIKISQPIDLLLYD